MIDLEIDGQSVTVAEGTSIIEAAEQLDIYIPRYCYHKHLSIAANCRMCLVEVEKARKPLPACATPVTQDMKVLTQSKAAIDAQRSVLEFLLINHPLDCPICDQGGVCELQDFALGYGNSHASFSENKNCVTSDNIGPLIETWMTRCIKCTRCVRFGDEIAGLRELGVVNRGEHSEISTYVNKFIDSELSANITDICPVGALTPKPSRYQARNWELQEHESISQHDCVGSNIYIHSRAGDRSGQRHVMNVVPRENVELNETWLSDRDRFSYCGLQSEDRCLSPMMKHKGEWVTSTWQRVLPEIVDRTRAIITHQGEDQLAFLASPSSTTEELYLLQKLARAVGTNNIDHRLRQQAFDHAESMPQNALGLGFEDIESCESILLVGSNIRHEQPLLSHRVRKAFLDDAIISAINPCDFNFNFDLSDKMITADLLLSVAQLAKALGVQHDALNAIADNAVAQNIAESLLQAENSLILFGNYAAESASAMQIKALAQAIEEQTEVKVGLLSSGANTAGAWLAGAVPHRDASGAQLSQPGKHVGQLLGDEPVRAYFLLNFEVEHDVAQTAAALKALKASGLVVCLSPFVSPLMKEYADFILPIAPFAENSGTLVNVAGVQQAFKACSYPHGDARPAWKVLRVMANFFDLDDFDYSSTEAVMQELIDLEQAGITNKLELTPTVSQAGVLRRYAYQPIYATDALVRRSQPLQQTALAENAIVRVNAATAEANNLVGAVKVEVIQGDDALQLPLRIDNSLADCVVALPSGLVELQGFGAGHSEIQVRECS
jgi:NADH-quinone oxidoreductase subunit G